MGIGRTFSAAMGLIYAHRGAVSCKDLVGKHVRICDLTSQWQLARIWIRDANMHSRPRRGLISEITSRDIAGKMLDEYFDMVEQILEQKHQCSSEK
jgi:hypothetical protein